MEMCENESEKLWFRISGPQVVDEMSSTTTRLPYCNFTSQAWCGTPSGMIDRRLEENGWQRMDLDCRKCGFLALFWGALCSVVEGNG